MVDHVAKRASNTGTALTRAAALWFLTAVAGQWVFVYYIAAFYGPTLVSGEFELWDRNRNMTDGYLAGDIVGNLFFAAHVLLVKQLHNPKMACPHSVSTLHNISRQLQMVTRRGICRFRALSLDFRVKQVRRRATRCDTCAPLGVGHARWLRRWQCALCAPVHSDRRPSWT